MDDEPERLSPLPSHTGQPEHVPVPTRRVSTPVLGIKRNAPTGSGSPSRQSTLNVPMARKRQSLIGAASSHGRLFKVLGDLFTLAGRTEDATVWCGWLSDPTCVRHLIDNARYTEALALFKTSTDSFWHASTLEGLATISLLDAWSGQGFVRASILPYCNPHVRCSPRI